MREAAFPGDPGSVKTTHRVDGCSSQPSLRRLQLPLPPLVLPGPAARAAAFGAARHAAAKGWAQNLVHPQHCGKHESSVAPHEAPHGVAGGRLHACDAAQQAHTCAEECRQGRAGGGFGSKAKGRGGQEAQCTRCTNSCLARNSIALNAAQLRPATRLHPSPQHIAHAMHASAPTCKDGEDSHKRDKAEDPHPQLLPRRRGLIVLQPLQPAAVVCRQPIVCRALPDQRQVALAGLCLTALRWVDGGGWGMTGEDGGARAGARASQPVRKQTSDAQHGKARRQDMLPLSPPPLIQCRRPLAPLLTRSLALVFSWTDRVITPGSSVPSYATAVAVTTRYPDSLFSSWLLAPSVSST